MDDFEKGEKVLYLYQTYVVKSIGQYDITIENKTSTVVIPFDHPFYNAIKKLNHD